MSDISTHFAGAWHLFYVWAGGQPVFLQILIAWGAIELLRQLVRIPLAVLSAYNAKRRYSASLHKADKAVKAIQTRVAQKDPVVGRG